MNDNLVILFEDIVEYCLFNKPIGKDRVEYKKSSYTNYGNRTNNVQPSYRIVIQAPPELGSYYIELDKTSAEIHNVSVMMDETGMYNSSSSFYGGYDTSSRFGYTGGYRMSKIEINMRMSEVDASYHMLEMFRTTGRSLSNSGYMEIELIDGYGTPQRKMMFAQLDLYDYRENISMDYQYDMKKDITMVFTSLSLNEQIY